MGTVKTGQSLVMIGDDIGDNAMIIFIKTRSPHPHIFQLSINPYVRVVGS